MSGRSAVAEVMAGAGAISEVAAELKDLEAAWATPIRRGFRGGPRAVRRSAGAV